MNLKRVVILLLSAVLIVLGALLPGIVGKQRDAADDGEIFFATINDIQLEFAESDMTMRQTIGILCGNRETVEIPEELASRTREDILGLANAAAVAYQEAGVAFQSEDGVNYGFNIMYLQPVLAYSNVDSSQSNIFWMINILGKDTYQSMSLTIDDRTGTVCSVDYADSNKEYTKAEMKNILYGFSGVYLAELGEEFYDFDSREILDTAKSPSDSSYLASEVSWWADGYEYRTTFFVNFHGFYTYLAPATY